MATTRLTILLDRLTNMAEPQRRQHEIVQLNKMFPAEIEEWRAMKQPFESVLKPTPAAELEYIPGVTFVTASGTEPGDLTATNDATERKHAQRQDFGFERYPKEVRDQWWKEYIEKAGARDDEYDDTPFGGTSTASPQRKIHAKTASTSTIASDTKSYPDGEEVDANKFLSLTIENQRGIDKSLKEAQDLIQVLNTENQQLKSIIALHDAALTARMSYIEGQQRVKQALEKTISTQTEELQILTYQVGQLSDENKIMLEQDEKLRKKLDEISAKHD